MSEWMASSSSETDLLLDSAFNEGNLEAEAAHADKLTEHQAKWLKEAHHLMVSRDYASCQALLLKLLQARPDDAVLALHAAIIHFLLGQSTLEELAATLASLLASQAERQRESESMGQALVSDVDLMGDEGAPHLLLINLALVLFWLGRYEQADNILARAKSAPEMGAPGSRSEALALAWRKLRVSIWLHLHCADAALEHLNDLDELKRKKTEDSENSSRSAFETLSRGHALVVSKQFKVFKRDLRSNGLTEQQTVAFEFMRANLEFFRGNHRKAQKLLTMAVGNEPSELDHLTQSLMLNNQACITLMLKKPNYAAIQLQEALVKHESVSKIDARLRHQRAQLTYNYGVALLHSGRFEDALRCLSSVTDALRRSPHVWLHMAECLIMSVTDRQYDLDILQQPSNISKNQAKREGKSFNIVHLPGVHFKLVGRGSGRKIILHDEEASAITMDRSQMEQRLRRARACLRNSLTLITQLQNSQTKSELCKSITRPSSKLSLLKANALVKLGYVSLSLNDPVMAVHHSEECLCLDNLPPGLTNLARLYYGEALVLLDRISEAIDFFDPKHVLDVSLDESSEGDIDASLYSGSKRVSGEKSVQSELAATKAIFSLNLATAFLLRGELERACELLEPLWNSRNTHCVGAAVLKAKLYVLLRRDQISAARELIHQNCALTQITATRTSSKMGRGEMAALGNDTPDDLVVGSVLMRMIRTLSSTDSGAEREREKAQLLKKFKETDQKLDSMVLANQKDLSKALQLYAKVSNRLDLARTKVATVRAALAACKELLRYKRDELKHHWLEGVEHKHTGLLLDKVENVLETEAMTTELLGAEETKLIATTNRLVVALTDLEGDLAHVEGLAKVRESINASRQELFGKLVKIASEEVFWAIPNGASDLAHRLISSANKGKTKRQQQFAALEDKKSGSVFALRLQHIQGANSILKSEAFDVSAVIVSAETDDNDIDVVASGGAGARVRRLVEVAECLSLLDRGSQAMDALRGQVFKELGVLLSRVSSTFVSSSSLVDLFSAILAAFVVAVDALHIFASCIDVANKKHSRQTTQQVSLEKNRDVWNKVQSVLQQWLIDYLDFDNNSESSGSRVSEMRESSTVVDQVDLNSCFAVNRSGRVAKVGNSVSNSNNLFRFELSKSTNIKESENVGQSTSNQDENAKETNTTLNEPKKNLICPPSPHNITAIYATLIDFIEFVEREIGYEIGSGQHCVLHTFVTEFIRDVFLTHIHNDNEARLADAASILDAWREVSNSEALHDLKATKPLLQSCVVMKQLVDDTFGFMQSLPPYSDHFLTLICSSLVTYKDTCTTAFDALVNDDSQKPTLAAKWIGEPALLETLRGLEAWAKLKRSSASEAISARDARQVWSLITTRRFQGAKALKDSDVLLNAANLKCLCQLQESLTWLLSSLSSVIERLRHLSSTSISGVRKLSENALHTLESQASQLDGLADSALFVLYLEVRLRCVYHLQPLLGLGSSPSPLASFAGGDDSTDPSLEVINLSNDLALLEQMMSSSLSSPKTLFIYEALDDLLSSILTLSAKHLRKMNANGVKKMCRNVFTLQQTLNAFVVKANRDSSLDAVKNYYELFNNDADSLITSVVERGPMFSVVEYEHVLMLMHRSDSQSNAEKLEARRTKMANVLKDAGMAV